MSERYIGAAMEQEIFKHTGLKNSLIVQIKDMAEEYGAEKIVLFGSRSRGTHQAKSDIDLAVYGVRDFCGFSFDMEEKLWTLLMLDIIDMSQKYVSERLIDEIERDGIVLYEKV